METTKPILKVPAVGHSTRMNEKLTADILAVCNTLGYSDDSKYYQDPQCLDSAKALVLYLRRDTDEHEVRRLLGDAQVLQRDLIPIHKLKECSDDLFEVVLRLMVNLTNHALLVYEEELPKNKKYRNHYITINRHLQAYKTAFLDDTFWRVISTKLKKLIQDMDVLLENQKLTVERILILIRNVLQIPADPAEEMRSDDDASVHDQVLWVLYTSGIEDLLLFIASSDTTREFCMHVLEIIALFFREQTGEQLARTSLERSLTEKAKDTAELTRCVRLENISKAKKQASVRSFGGTFVVRGVDGPSGRNLICHKPVNSLSDLSLDSVKKTKKTPSNRRQIVEPSNVRRSTLSVRLMLKEFCVEFLSGAYNNLMRIVKDHLIRSKGQEHDETYYLFAIRFFMEFNRFHKFRVAYVSETMNTSTFHYVQGLIDNFHGLMITEKEKLILWSKRLHVALRAYQELLASLYVMEKVPGSVEASRGIQSTLFYLPEYRELCVGLLGRYEEAKWSRNYLCDLVDTNHLFLKMLEGSTKEKRILVKGTKRPRAPKKKSSRKSTKRSKKNSLEEWNCLENELSEFLSSDFELEAAIPFDAASDTPIDEQKSSALTKIATHIFKKDFSKAVSLFRASKEVWPDDDQLSMENAISSLKSIFLQASSQHDDDPAGRRESSEDEEDEEDAIDEEEDTEIYVSSLESEFDFRGFLEKYATAKIVANFGNLFKQYSALTPVTLYAILKMFHRYVFDMGYPALICQATIFQTFQSLIKIINAREDFKEFHNFFIHFWSKFVQMSQSNPKIFLELLFWKTSREAQEIQEGYTLYNHNQQTTTGVKRVKASVVRKILTAEEENEIVVLAEEFASLSDKALKQVDWINDKLINGPKVKKIISTFLSEKGLLISTKRKTTRKPWSETDVSRLRATYEEFKSSRSLMRHILEKITEKRSRNAVIDKMLEIGLIRDKSELSRRKSEMVKKGKAIGVDFLRENGVSFGASSSSGSSSENEAKNSSSSESEDENRDTEVSSNRQNEEMGSSKLPDTLSPENVDKNQSQDGSQKPTYSSSSSSKSDISGSKSLKRKNSRKSRIRKFESDSDDDLTPSLHSENFKVNSIRENEEEMNHSFEEEIDDNLGQKSGHFETNKNQNVSEYPARSSSGSDSEVNKDSSAKTNIRKKATRRILSDSENSS